MFCPRCGSTQSDELKFCKACGANLYAVRQVVDNREPEKKFDWGNTWVADMLMSGEEAERRQAEIEHRRGVTPAVRRYQEIKAGVITSSVGVGIGVFLLVFMQGVILSGNVSPAAAQILSRIWLAGLIPFMVGLALIFNGVVVSKKIVELSKSTEQLGPGDQERVQPQQLRSADTTEFVPSKFSVTEETTRHLGSQGGIK